MLAKYWGSSAAASRFAAGAFRLFETSHPMTVAEIPARFPGVLDGESHGILARGSCAYGCRACELEIEPDTGQIEILAYSAVDDFGDVQNPAAVRGQVQGGVVQGIAQAALQENVARDRDSGQVLSGSLMNYTLPRATDVPDVRWMDNGLISRTNVFGAKACGEAGASAAPPAVTNAIANALSAFPAARDLQMPARAVDIWQTIHAR